LSGTREFLDALDGADANIQRYREAAIATVGLIAAE